MDQQGQKPTLLDIRTQHYFDIQVLASQAGVPAIVLYTMLIGEPVQQLHAELVLNALSELTGNPYTLETVSVRLFAGEGQENQEDEPHR